MAIDWYLTAEKRGYASPRDMLFHIYSTQGHTMDMLADLFEVSTSTIRAALNRFAVPIRPHGGPRVKTRRD